MKFSVAFSFLAALPLTLAAPTCSLKKTSTAAVPSPTSVTTPSNPSSGNTTSGNTTTGAGTSGPISMAWFADWHPNYFVSNISWSGYTHMSFFTAQPAADATVEVVLSDETMPDQFTAAAHANGVKALLTVGGWSTGIYWSSSIATPGNRSTFASSLVAYANAHNFDGLDFDWEYPNKQGIGCNTINVNDTNNFLEFIKEVKQQGPNLTYSAAVGIVPFNDNNGQPSTNVSGFAEYLDWIEIMNYDVFGTFSSVTGPNAPLDDSCAPSSGQQGSATTAVAAWTKAGFPASKIVLGVPAYGHSFNVPASTAVAGSTLNLYTTFDKTNIPMGDAWDPTVTQPDICGNPPVGNGNSGVWNFWALVDGGYLNQDGTVTSSMVGYFDNCSQTPFLYDPSSSMLLSYDNAQSFTAKGQYISQAGLAGFAMYEAGGDYNDILVNAINKGMGSSK